MAVLWSASCRAGMRGWSELPSSAVVQTARGVRGCVHVILSSCGRLRASRPGDAKGLGQHGAHRRLQPRRQLSRPVGQRTRSPAGAVAFCCDARMPSGRSPGQYGGARPVGEHTVQRSCGVSTAGCCPSQVPGRENSVDAKQLAADGDSMAPSGRQIQPLLLARRGGLYHATLSPGSVSQTVSDDTVEEMRLFLGDHGHPGRRRGRQEEDVELGPGTCLTIPAGAQFGSATLATNRCAVSSLRGLRGLARRKRPLWRAIGFRKDGVGMRRGPVEAPMCVRKRAARARAVPAVSRVRGARTRHSCQQPARATHPELGHDGSLLWATGPRRDTGEERSDGST